VIGDDVDDEPHAVRTQRVDQIVELGTAADLRIDLVVIDHVVAMLATRPRAQEWRAVEVAHAQPREVGDDGAGVLEAELAVQLHPIGRPRNDRCRPATLSARRPAVGHGLSHPATAATAAPTKAAVRLPWRGLRR
jgi:hypothetical protein